MIAGSRVVFWIRLDRPGNDACRFAETGKSLLIEGSATGVDGSPLNYRVRARADGVTRRARVGTLPRLVVRREKGGVWFLNDAEVPAVKGAKDFDLGLTPATNTLTIRRLALGVGDQAETLAAWLDPEDWTLKPLRQTYKRVGETSYDYRSDTGYSAQLETDDFGIVQTYPGWWEARG